MKNYVVNFPTELGLLVEEMGKEIVPYWYKEQFVEAEDILKKQYLLIRKIEERKIPDGKRFHKGPTLHGWGLAILKQKNLARLEEGYYKLFLAYIEDLLDYDNLAEVLKAPAYNALTGNPLIKEELLEILNSRVEKRKRSGRIPKNPEDIMPNHTIVTGQQDFLNDFCTKLKKNIKKEKLSKNVFIVHGHDDKLKLELARILRKLRLNPIILSEQPDKGKTIIEKLEQNSLNIGYVFVLLTPDDMVASSSENLNSPHVLRARQNVILELGYFIGKLGREKVCCLYKNQVELPSDIHGIIYQKLGKSVDECFMDITKELKAIGYKIKL